jgi:hypothetical protein
MEQHINNYKKYIKFGGYFLLVTIFTEYLTFDLDNVYYHPSFYFNELKNIFVESFIAIGKCFGYLSDFLHLIKFEKMLLSITRIINPIIISLYSPLYVIKGYFDYIRNNITTAHLIYTGSGILILGSLYGLIKLKKLYDTKYNLNQNNNQNDIQNNTAQEQNQNDNASKNEFDKKYINFVNYTDNNEINKEKTTSKKTKKI